MPSLNDWLAAHGLERYAERFAEQRIDFDVLADLDEADLEKLGVALGDRKRVLKALRGLPAAEAASDVDTGSAPVVELRQVTILFVDLSGYTQLTASLGAEATHKLVQRFYAVATGIVASHSGSVERHIGDAIMAVFGLPVAHGNDPERALRAAQAIHEAMPALGAEVGRDVRIHAGIASGQVVASRSGADFATVGDAVNLAARLVNLAQAGDTILSDSVQRALGTSILAEAIDGVTVKGFERPVRAWRVREWRAQRTERPALVGRDAELRQFDTLCAECLARRRGALVVVRGEAGIGKTRLLEEFGGAASAAGFAVHNTLMLDFGAGRALDPIARLIASILGAASALGSSARQAVLDGARRAALLREDETMWAADLLDLPMPAALHPVYDAMDSATRQRRRSELAATLVQRASAVQPLLLQIEDVHWGSAAALDTLTAIAQSIYDHRVVLVLTTRVQGDPTTGAWRERMDPRLPALTLELQPLPETLARTLGHSLGVLDDAVLEMCVRRAAGNPLFLEQLLRNAAAGDGESVPGSIQSIVLARLDRLQPRDRRALQAASVLGQFFSLPVLQHLLADPGYRCDALLAERLVRELGDEYLFAHALVWEGTYVSLLTDQKREWHARAADWFAQRDPMLTAEHLERAQSAHAARAYLDAGRVELAAHRHDRALRAFERGLGLTEDAAERATLLTELAQLLLTTGRPHDALAAYERLLELADGAAQRARARLGVAHALRLLDRSSEALAALDQAEHEADEVLEQGDRARLHYLRGSLFFPLGQVQAGLHEQTRALEHARSAGSIELQLRALSGLGDAHYAGGKVVSAYRCFRECVELSHAHDIVQVEAVNLPMLAICEYFVTRMDEGLRHARAGLQLAQRVGNPRAELIARHSICMLSLEVADPVLAIDHARASLEIARTIGARRFVPEGMMFIANCLSWEGRRAEARALMLEALELAREHITYCGPWILGALAVHAQNDTERRAWLREGEEVLQAGVPAHNYIGFYSDAIQASLDTAAWDEALRYCDLLEASFRAEPAPLAEFTVGRGRALARLGKGSRDQALREEVVRLIEQGQQARLRVSVAALQAAARCEGWTVAGT